MKRKGMNAMAKFLVPLVIFLSANLGDAFVNHARLNHLIRFQQPMSNSTNEPSREPIGEPTNDWMNDQTTHGMNEQTEVPLQQSGTSANVSQQLVPAANSEGAKVASKNAHQLPTSSHSTNRQLMWQSHMEIDKMKSNKREPIASHSSIKQDKSTPTF
jgi:hypothetical protein